ncbi:GNAT family N-acetyltransferase [Dongia deserti]|uniref:GNAT family N-acetyltransferase n=1 Tax=Dongia deserti TaxID=2268030 RepID=UPI000E653E2B|nr:GNAT family N-acetyltransferase [Dongia deserti]
MPPNWKLTILRTSKEAILRPMLGCDITQAYAEGLNNPVVFKFLSPPPPGGWNAENMRGYVVDNWNSDSNALFGIYYRHQLVGTTRLHGIEWNRSRAVLGICIFDTSVWGMGLATSTIIRIVEFATDELGLSEINAGIKQGNVGSCEAFKKAGFRQIENSPNGDLQYSWTKTL